MNQAKIQFEIGKDPPLIANAYHEAGHAVIGWLCGSEARSAQIGIKETLDRSGNYKLGCVTPIFQMSMSAITRWRVTNDCKIKMREGIIMRLLSGPVTVGHKFPKEYIPRNTSRQSDYSRVRFIIGRYFKEQHPEETLKRYEATTLKMVKYHWKAIDTVAKALFKKLKLDRYEIKDIIHRAEPVGGFKWGHEW